MPAKNGRNVSLTDEQHGWVEQLVQSGRYASASEVVRAGLRLLQQEEHARLLEKWLVSDLRPEEAAAIPDGVLDRLGDEVRAKIRQGLEEARRGQAVPGEDFFAAWAARLRDQ